ncbi:MAG TPA: SCO family protein [Gemmatimonadales bacterium]|jgi:protein SCO1/2|nr:SCO family protein [Gemmatimonadales bacterium]
MTRSALLAVLAIAGCAARPRLEELRGPRMSPALPKPGFVLQNLDGSPFNFRSATRGSLTFLFFGYTNCPDVCPLQLSNLAWGIHQLPPEQARGIHVVFVSTDPARDTPERLRRWLAQFDSSFTAVTGTPAALELAQRTVGMPPAVHEGELPQGGGYGVTHAAQLWAFTPDDSAHVMYPWGVRREDLAADIKTLLRIWPSTP